MMDLGGSARALRHSHDPTLLGMELDSCVRRLETPVPSPERSLWLGVHRSARTTPRIRVALGFLTETLGRLKTALKPA